MPARPALAARSPGAACAVPPTPGDPTRNQGDTGARASASARWASHADGIFGAGTERAVKRFQRRHHLDADGIVGPRPGACPPHLRRHARGAPRRRAGVRTRGVSVRLLQRRLGIAADGVFGPGTARAVRSFQRAPRPDRRRRRRPGDLVRARRRRPPPRAQARAPAPGRGGARASPPRSARDRRRQPHRQHALPLRRRPRLLPRQRLRLLGLGLLRAARAGRSAARWTPASSWLGQPGPGRWITIYANAGHAFMVVNGRRFDTSGR